MFKYEFPMGRHKAIRFIKPLRFDPRIIAGHFYLNDALSLDPFFHFADKHFADAFIPVILRHDQLLDFRDFAAVMKQFVNINAAEPHDFFIDLGNKITDIFFIEILLKQFNHRFFWKSRILQRADQLIDFFRVLLNRLSDFYAHFDTC